MSMSNSKLSASIEKEIMNGFAAKRRVVIHAGCFTCRQHLEKRNIHIIHEIPMLNAYVAEVPMRALPALATKGYVRYIEDDKVVRITMDRARQTVQDVPEVCGNLTGQGITIAAIDTGIYPHQDFIYPRNRILQFIDLVNGRTQPYDDNGHGTFCMGCAGGNGHASSGLYSGAAPQANLIMIKAMDASGGGTISDILLAMQWISNNQAIYGIRVLSMSLGIDAANVDPVRDTLAQAAEILWRQGIVVVAAAGNSGPEAGTINSPGTAPSIITVGAIDDRGEVLQAAGFSSRDRPGGNKPDLIAPGVNVRSTRASPEGEGGGGYINMSGTSVSTPIVAGCAALVLENKPWLTPSEVKGALMNSAVSINQPANVQGRGVVSMKGAL